jgi:hypothetical protein
VLFIRWISRILFANTFVSDALSSIHSEDSALVLGGSAAGKIEIF